MAESNAGWGDLAENDDELAAVWDSFPRLPEPGANDVLDAFVARKNLTIPALAKLGTRLATETTLAFAFHGGIKYRNMEDGTRWSYKDSEFTRLKIVRAGAKHADTVILAEGETDAARLTILYPGADIAVLPAGAKRFHEGFANQLADYAVVAVGLDNDEAGTAGYDKVKSLLPRALRFAPPGVNDWCALAPDAEVPPLPTAEQAEASGDLVVGGVRFENFEDHLDKALKNQLPPVDYMVEPTLYTKGVHWLSGEPGLGKSVFALALCLIAMAEERHVVWLDYESGFDLHVRRMAQCGYSLEQSMRLFHYAWYPDNIVQHLAPLAEKWPDCLIVIDSASKALAQAGIDENENSAVTSWTMPLIQFVKRYELPCIVIDHDTKGNKGRYSRGASAKLADADVQLRLLVAEGSEKFNKTTRGMIEVRNDKDRLGDMPHKHFYMVGDGNGGLPIDPCEGPATEDKDEPKL